MMASMAENKQAMKNINCDLNSEISMQYLYDVIGNNHILLCIYNIVISPPCS